MKRITLALLSATFSITAFAQTPKIDYDKIIPQGNASSEAERLVQIAWQNQPTNELYKQQTIISSQDEKAAKSLWLNDLYINSNLNEYNTGIKKVPQYDAAGNEIGKSSSNAFFPLFNLGITYRFGTLSKINTEVRKAQAEIKITEEKVHAEKIRLRAAVLRAYANYKSAREHLILQTETTEDASARFKLAEQRFKDGKMNLDDLNRLTDYYNSEKGRQIDAESRMAITKADLEELLGVTLEQAAVK